MAIKISQSLKQTQNLTMTPQLQQAIKMLTLTHLEMTNMIATEMVENPVLEEMGGGDSNEADMQSGDYSGEACEIQAKEVDPESFNADTVIKKDDFDWQTYVENYNSSTYTPPNMATHDPEDNPNYENMVTSTGSLADHLEWQLRMESLTEKEWLVAEQIIHNINSSGYLDIEIDEIIKQTGHDREDVLEILKMIQRLDPVGCGARDIKECLLIQAQALEERSPLVERIISDHLEDLQVKDYNKIAQVIGVDKSKIKDAELIIQTFHPKPGRLIAHEETHYILPDIYVVEVGGEFTVQLNDEGVPRLRVSKLYQDMLKEESSGQEAKDFVQDKLRQALWLIKSIQNRQRTIHKVAKAIVRQQQDFFRKGPEFLKPMILRDIADEIGMHESTVSRVTTNKYMHSPIGTFELKFFFSTGVGGKNGGSDVSNEALKIKLKRFIDNENPKRPLSDQKLAELLSEEDVQIARRTVAKYRELLGIASSSQRKNKE